MFNTEKIEELEKRIRSLEMATVCYAYSGHKIDINSVIYNILTHLKVEIMYSPPNFKLQSKED